MPDKKAQIGEEIEALCGSCKGATVHIIESIKNDKIVRVMCKICLSSHRFRKPEELLALKSKRKSEPKKPVNPAVKSQRKWSRLVSKMENETPKDYHMTEKYVQNDVIVHSKFGTGVVVSVVDPTKITVVFEEGQKTLIHNRI
jgi:hypothetical protein